jgi:hypothetical protein
MENSALCIARPRRLSPRQGGRRLSAAPPQPIVRIATWSIPRLGCGADLEFAPRLFCIKPINLTLPNTVTLLDTCSNRFTHCRFEQPSNREGVLAMTGTQRTSRCKRRRVLPAAQAFSVGCSRFIKCTPGRAAVWIAASTPDTFAPYTARPGLFAPSRIATQGAVCA